MSILGLFQDLFSPFTLWEESKYTLSRYVIYFKTHILPPALYLWNSASASHFSFSSTSRVWRCAPAWPVCCYVGWVGCGPLSPGNRSSAPSAGPSTPLQWQRSREQEPREEWDQRGVRTVWEWVCGGGGGGSKGKNAKRGPRGKGVLRWGWGNKKWIRGGRKRERGK